MAATSLDCQPFPLFPSADSKDSCATGMILEVATRFWVSFSLWLLQSLCQRENPRTWYHLKNSRPPAAVTYWPLDWCASLGQLRTVPPYGLEKVSMTCQDLGSGLSAVRRAADKIPVRSTYGLLGPQQQGLSFGP